VCASNNTFRAGEPDGWQTADGLCSYRLCGDGFYFKLSSRVQLEVLSDSHKVDRARVEGRRILVFDDLFRSGTTMNSITAALYDDGRAADVFVLTITRTRSKQ
jgi:hypothetical protein